MAGGRKRETFPLGTALVEIVKRETSPGDSFPRPRGQFTSSLEIAALGGQRCFQNILIVHHVIT